MKKITISKEGCSPIDILVDNDGAVKTVESAGNCVYSDEGTVTISTEEPTESRESIDLSSMSTVDRVFAEMTRESFDPSRSEEAVPRLSGIKPVAILRKRSMSKQVFVGAIDTYLSGQKPQINKIKEYLNKKGWVNLGLAGLSREPTLFTDVFKVFGGNTTSRSIRNPRDHLIEKEVDGLKIVFVFTDNNDNSEYAKKHDIRSAKNKMVGHLILTKEKNDKKNIFFCKQITPIILVDSESDGKSQYSTDINVNTSKAQNSK